MSDWKYCKDGLPKDGLYLCSCEIDDMVQVETCVLHRQQWYRMDATRPVYAYGFYFNPYAWKEVEEAAPLPKEADNDYSEV